MAYVILSSDRRILVRCFKNLALVTFMLWALIGCNARSFSKGTAATYFVDGSDGNDQNGGTQEQPWRTLDKANQTLQAGDTVIIRAGSYDDVIAPLHSGAPGQRITYTHLDGEVVQIRGKPGLAQLALIRQSYILIDGLEFRYGHDLPKKDRNWVWVLITGSDTHDNVIRNCRLIRDGDPLTMYREKYQERGIVLNGVDHNLIENNYIRGLNKGIHINQGAQYNRIVNNYVTETSQSAIVVGSSKGVIQGNLIERNVLERSAIEDGIQFTQDFEAEDKADDVSNLGTIVRNNVIRYNSENAIDLKGAALVVLEGNVIYGTIGSNNGGLNGWNRNSLSAIGRGKDASSRDIIIRKNVLYDNANGARVYDGYKVYNNTILYNNRDYEGNQGLTPPSNSAYFFGISEREQGTKRLGIKNNLVGGHRFGGEVILRVGKSSDLDIDYNLYFNPENVQIVDFNTVGNLDAYDLAGWQHFLAGQRTVIGNEAHSIVVADPKLAYGSGLPDGDLNASAFDPRSDSPAIDRGGPLTLTMEDGTGTRLPVLDASYFSDGYGIVPGDWVQVGSNDWTLITAIDYEQNILTLASSIEWQADDWVTLPYNGAGPDIGAREAGGDPVATSKTSFNYLPLITIAR